MSNSKHTPGPWEVVKSAPQGKSRIDIKSGRLCKIARIFHAPHNYEANASLIVVAPEMLDLLERILAQTNPKDKSHPNVLCFEHAIEIRSLIFKATTGEQR
jgi:hypothetical protein